MVEAAAEEGVRILVSVDGSDNSHDAYLMTVDGLLEKGDSLRVGHIHDNRKTYLPAHFKPEAIEAKYTGDITNYDHSDFISQDVGVGRTTKQAMNDLAKSSKSHLMVVGWRGRKGPKEDPSIMGSAVTYLGLEAVCPVAIIKEKKTRSERGGSFRWAVAFDGDENSLQGLVWAAKFMHKSVDVMEVISVVNSPSEAEKFGAKAEKFFADHGINGKFTRIDRNGRLPIAQNIDEYLMSKTDESEYFDFIVITNHGANFASHHGAKYLGSVAEGILKKAKLNILFVPSHFR